MHLERNCGASRRLILTRFGRTLPLALALCASGTFAQDNSNRTAPTTPLQFQVLQSWKADAGNHSVYFNLVAPPAFPAPTPQPAPVAPPAGPSDPPAPQKKYISLMITATVYDHQITDLRLSGPNGPFQAFSNVDFNYLTGVQTFETDDTTYACFVIVDNQNSSALSSTDLESAELAQVKTVLPNLQTAPAGTASQYAVAEGTANANTDITTALSALHLFYDNCATQLIQAYQQRLAAAAAAAQQQSQNPPAPKDTVINFWPIKSNLFSTAPATGGGQ